MVRAFWLAAVSVIVALFGVHAAGAAGAVQLSGTVTKADGSPLSGIALGVEGSSATTSTSTDVDGHYSLVVAPGTDYQIRIDSTNWFGFGAVHIVAWTSHTLDLTNDRNVDIVLPISPLRVHVVGTDGTPVPQAAVTVQPPNSMFYATMPDIPGTTTQVSELYTFSGTDSDGIATVNALPTLNDLTVAGTPPNGSNYAATNATIPAGTTGDYTITLDTFSGQIANTTGTPLPQQDLKVSVPSTPTDIATATTDAEGQFGVTTDPGIYDVSLDGELGTPDTPPAAVARTATAQAAPAPAATATANSGTHYTVKSPKVDLRKPKGDQHLVVPTRTITLHAVDATGKAVPNAAVSMKCTTTSFALLGRTAKGTQCATETIDANGNAVLTVLPTATVSVTVTPPAGPFLKPATVTFAPTDGLQKTITLAALPTPTVVLTPSTAGPYVTGQQLTYTVTTASRTTGGAIPTGTVTVSVDGTPVTTKTLQNGTTTVPVTLPGAARHTVTARYNGNATYSPLTTTTAMNIAAAATTLTVTPTPTTPVWGQTVAVTAVVAPAAPGTGTPTGQVQVKLDGTTQPALTLSSGRTTQNLTGLAPGTHTLTVTYPGTTDYRTSTSTTTFTVNPATTRTTIVSSSPSGSTTGQRIVFRARTIVLSPGTGTPTGSVVFTIDGIDQTPTTLVNGTALLATSTLTAGTHQITARYTGPDPHYSTSTATPITQTVTAS